MAPPEDSGLLAEWDGKGSETPPLQAMAPEDSGLLAEWDGKGSEAISEACSEADSVLLNDIMHENAKYRVEVELLRVRLAEAELLKIPARRSQASPPIRPPRHILPIAALVVMAVFGGIGCLLASQHTQVRKYQQELAMMGLALEDERAELANLKLEFSVVEDQLTSCQMEIEDSATATRDLVVTTVGPCNLLGALADLAIRAGRQFFRVRSSIGRSTSMA